MNDKEGYKSVQDGSKNIETTVGSEGESKPSRKKKKRHSKKRNKSEVTPADSSIGAAALTEPLLADSEEESAIKKQKKRRVRRKRAKDETTQYQRNQLLQGFDDIDYSDEQEEMYSRLRDQQQSYSEPDENGVFTFEKSAKEGGVNFKPELNRYDNIGENGQLRYTRNEIAERLVEVQKGLKKCNTRGWVNYLTGWVGSNTILDFSEAMILAAAYNSGGARVEDAECDPNKPMGACRQNPRTIALKALTTAAIGVSDLGAFAYLKRLNNYRNSFKPILEEMDKLIVEMDREHEYNPRVLDQKRSFAAYIRLKFWEELALKMGFEPTKKGIKKFFSKFSEGAINKVDSNLVVGIEKYFLYLTQEFNNDDALIEKIVGKGGQIIAETFVDNFVEMNFKQVKWQKIRRCYSFEYIIPASNIMYYVGSAMGKEFNPFLNEGNFAYLEEAALANSSSSSSSGEKIPLNSSLAKSDLLEKELNDGIIPLDDDRDLERAESGLEAYRREDSASAVDNFTTLCIPQLFGDKQQRINSIFTKEELDAFFAKRDDRPGAIKLERVQNAVIESRLSTGPKSWVVDYVIYPAITLLSTVAISALNNGIGTDRNKESVQNVGFIAVTASTLMFAKLKSKISKMLEFSVKEREQFADSVKNLISVAGFLKVDPDTKEFIIEPSMKYILLVSTITPLLVADHYNVEIERTETFTMFLNVFNAFSRFYVNEKRLNYPIEDLWQAQYIANEVFKELKDYYSYSWLNMGYLKNPYKVSLTKEIPNDMIENIIRRSMRFTSNSPDLTRMLGLLQQGAEGMGIEETAAAKFLQVAIHDVREFKRNCHAVNLNIKQQDKLSDVILDDMANKVDSLNAGEKVVPYNILTMCEKVTRMRVLNNSERVQKNNEMRMLNAEKHEVVGRG